ncbi:MAG: DUF3427 domain-containing protein [Clostridia bacterium]|nr:DUF3427 domain-containing protein [Clostridia bacterium]
MEFDPNNALPPGIYDHLINHTQQHVIAALPPDLHAITEVLATDDIGLISQYVERMLRDRLKSVGNVEQKVHLVNRVVSSILANEDQNFQHDYELTGQVLRAVSHARNENAFDVLRPDTPISENAIFTAGMNQLALGPQLVKEISTSDEIYFLVSFIRQSGLDILWSALHEFDRRGGALHVLTTTYMGATQLAAIDRLMRLNNADIRISFDARFTRLHAKAYVFLRASGAHTCYIGSSNLTNPALTDGLEWNVKIAAMASPQLFETILATCDAYRHDEQFEIYNETMRDRLAAALNAGQQSLPNSAAAMTLGEVAPYRYQEAILERLEVERVLHGRYRNLVVAATGTGKTVIAAFDYKRYRESRHRARLLFVAHRQEILEQARQTFRDVLGEPDFGALQVGEHTADDEFDHLFVSIQSLNSMKFWEILNPDYYDYIVVDEMHHSAAPSYKRFLAYFQPHILLGLTATPERHDGQSILDDYFDGLIAAEIRLPQAIDEGLLCPFRYFGLPDTVDLDQVKWTRGGYDTHALENIYVMDAIVAERRASHVLEEFLKHVGNVNDVHGLGFCVSIAHAEFMAKFFNDHGVSSATITGNTNAEERRERRRKLENGEINVIFCVDVFNEGIDIPCINTVLLLRPTESLTIFVQQLGRGLRLYKGKDNLLVLDFIGAANRNYRFEEKFSALLPANQSVGRAVKDRFIHLPRGCYIELAEKPMQIVLESIARGFSNERDLIARVQEYVAEQGVVPNVAEFLAFYNLKPQQVYKVSTFDAILRKAGYIDGAPEPLAEPLRRKGMLRLSYIDSFRWLRRVAELLDELEQVLAAPLTADDDLMLRMLFTTIWPNDAIPAMNSEEAKVRFEEFERSPRLLAEMKTLLTYSAQNVATMSIPLDIGTACPLDIRCTYTRNQILAAMRYANPRGMQTGVLWIPDLNTDVFLITVRKTDTQFGPNTMYDDYAIDARTFHWQSQNSTSPESVVGQRYINQASNGSHVLLFVREAKEDQFGPVPYTFLGPAEFVSSTGSKPMSIVWRLRYAMDVDFEARVSRVVV